MFLSALNFFEPACDKLPEEIQSIGEKQKFPFLNCAGRHDFLTIGELENFLPPIRMNFRQFITSGRFLLLSFDRSKERR
ncbi:MAG: hypothetical protein R2942_03940 [Ignavibacteria bacterium]